MKQPQCVPRFPVLGVPPLLTFVFVLGACGGTSAPGAENAKVEEVLRGLRPAMAIVGRPPVRWTLAERMDALHVPGVSIAVLDSGRIVWARGFGVKEAGRSDSVTTETLFQAQSISKPVAATAMLRLVDEGRVTHDANVNDYLRSWKVPDNRFTLREKVTLRRLVSHSAGLTVGGFLGYLVDDSVPTLRQIFDGVRPANNPPIRVDTIPGTLSRYSGGGLTVLQQLLIDVTNESFPNLMRRLVLAPARMTRSGYEQPLPESRRRDAVSGHDPNGVVIKGKWPVHPEMAAAGLWTTPTDLARWAIEISDSWAGREGKLISTETARQMLTMQKPPFGLGPQLSGTGDALRFMHSGSIQGFKAELVMFAAAGKGAVVMTNGDGGADLIDEVFQSIASAYQWPGYRQTERVIAIIEPAVLEGLVGVYSAPGPAGGHVTIEVSRENDRVFFVVPGFLPKGEIYPLSADSFFTAKGSSVVFTRDQLGRVVKLNLGGQVEATKRQ